MKFSFDQKHFYFGLLHFPVLEKPKFFAPGEDRTHDLQITQAVAMWVYETDALPTALPRHMEMWVDTCPSYEGWMSGYS